MVIQNISLYLKVVSMERYDTEDEWKTLESILMRQDQFIQKAGTSRKRQCIAFMIFIKH